VQFRILGPLEVAADDGVPVAVGGPKPRALLAELLLHPRAVVPADRLVDAVWGDAPPPNAAVALRAYVSRLRAVLPPLAGAPRLRYRAPGYELELTPDELDAGVFAQLVAEAREHAAAVCLRVRPEHAVARRCYERAGYRRATPEQERAWNEGQPTAYVWMLAGPEPPSG